MQFTVNRGDLVRELGLALGAVERRSTIPILQNVKLEADTILGRLGITATDLDIGIQCWVKANVTAPGAATIPAKRLLDYVRLLPEGDINVKFGETFWATITAGRSRTRIAGESADKFPELAPRSETQCAIQPKQLAQMIQQTSFAISTEETRFTVNGALFEADGEYLRMVATDGHRLALTEVPADVKIEGKNLIPRKALAEISRLAGSAGADAAVEIASDSNHLFFTIAGRSLTARRLTGSFPDYLRVLPRDLTGHATVGRQALKDALARVRNFADERTRSVKLGFTDGHITAFSGTSETGESEESVPAEIGGGPLTAAFNADYLLDFLGATDAEMVSWRFKDANSATQLSTEAGDGRYLYVLMPMRI